MLTLAILYGKIGEKFELHKIEIKDLQSGYASLQQGREVVCSISTIRGL